MRIGMRLSSLVLAAGMAASGTANANDDLVRGLLGIGAAAILLNNAQQQAPARNQRQRTKPNRVDENQAERIEQRKEIQRRLVLLGYDVGQPTGSYGPKTRRAIAAFQASMNRQPTGKISQEEVALLYQQTDGMADASSQWPALGDNQYPPAPGSNGNFPPLGPQSEQTAAGGAGGQAPSSGFPRIGGGSQPGTQAFPPLGVANGANGSAFPKLGTQAAPGENSGFPSLGKTADTGSPQAFPKLGETDTASTEQTFPKMRSAQPAGSQSFPELSPQAAAASKQDANLPPLTVAPPADKQIMPAVTASTTPDPKFPDIGATPEEAKAGMPVLAPAPPTDAALRLSDLATEVALTPFHTPDGQPAILGAKLGQPIADVRSSLEKQGFASCESTGLQLACRRENQSLSDLVVLWSSGDDGLWGIVRTIRLREPTPRSLIDDQLRSSYPELMVAESHRIFSSDGCKLVQAQQSQLPAMLDVIAASDADAAKPIDRQIVDYAARCPLSYGIAFDGEESASVVTIAFANTTKVPRLLSEHKAKAEAADKQKREKLSSDLKL